MSDGLYERGIYINRVRKGGPADLSGLLQAFDRILQVNFRQIVIIKLLIINIMAENRLMIPGRTISIAV